MNGSLLAEVLSADMVVEPVEGGVRLPGLRRTL